MLKPSAHHISTNIPSTGATSKSALSINRRSRVSAPLRPINSEYVNYTALDTFRRETILKEEEAHQVWRGKFDPWLINEYRQMYESVAKNRGVPPDDRVISLKRPEWQQPVDSLPPLHKRLAGQRRRRLLGSFPETESDRIGWRLLPEHAIDIYGSKTANIAPLPKQYKFSSWPVESFY